MANCKHFLIASLVTFAVVAPSASVRADGAADQEAAWKTMTQVAPAPSPVESQLQLAWLLSPDFPCLPFLPKIVLDLCHLLFPPSPSPESKTCRPTLLALMPCAGFLTGVVPAAPPAACCDGVGLFFTDAKRPPLCICHVVNGDVGRLFAAPVNATRTAALMPGCKYSIRFDTLTEVCRRNSDKVPPIDLPCPAPPARGKNKAPPQAP